MIRRILSAIFTFMLIASIFIIPISATKNGEQCVYDIAGLFTDAEIERIENEAQKCFDDTDCSVYIVTDPCGFTVGYVGDDFVDEYLGGHAGNSVILIITDNYEHNYNLYTYGKCDRRISDSEVNEILDHELIYVNIKNQADLEMAALQFINMSADACEPKTALAITLGIIIGLVAAGATAAGIILCYNRKSRSEKYPLDRFASLDLFHRSDVFMGKFVTRRTIRTSSGGGRGGRSGGGGGGGHRGGR